MPRAGGPCVWSAKNPDNAPGRLNPTPVRFPKSFRIALALHSLLNTTLFCIGHSYAEAQSFESSFLVRESHPLPLPFKKMAIMGDGGSRPVRLLLSLPGTDVAGIAQFDSVRDSMSVRILHFPTTYGEIYSADLNNDGAADFIVLRPGRRTVYMSLSLDRDTLNYNDSLQLPFEPRDLLVGDCNNDGVPDLLVSDKKNPGIHLYLGDGKGSLRKGPVVARGVPAGPFILTDLNDDGIADLFLYDWVGYHFETWYGVGRGRFLEQSIFPGRGLLASITTLQATSPGSFRFAATCTEPREIQLWRSNELGEIQRTGVFSMEAEPSSVALGVSKSAGEILAVLEGTRLSLVNITDEGKLGEKQSLYAGDAPRAVVLANLSGGGANEAIVLDEASPRLLVYRSAGAQILTDDSVTIATPLNPAGVVAADFNRNGMIDIASVCQGGNSIFLLLGDTATGSIERTVYPLSNGPSTVNLHEATDSTVGFVITYPTEDSVSTFNYSFRDNSYSNAMIPTDGLPEVLFGGGMNRETIEFGTMNSPSNGDRSLSFYQRLGPTTFLEKNFRLSSPAKLLGSVVDDVNHDSLLDIIYAYKANDSSAVEIGVAFGDSDFTMKRRVASLDLGLPETQHASMWAGSMRRGDTLDLLISFGQPSNELVALRGRGDGSFGDPSILSTGVLLGDRTQLEIVDADGDGRPDVVLNSSMTGCLSWIRNSGDGRFEAERVLLHDSGENHFAIADVNRDGVRDLIVSVAHEGALKIFTGRLFFPSPAPH